MGEVKTLKDVLGELKEKHHAEWIEVEEEFMSKVHRIKDIVESKIEQGKKFGEEDAEEILKQLDRLPKNYKFILGYIADEVLLKILNDE